MANGNGGWKWLGQGAITVALAALAAFVGIRVGMAEMRVNQANMEKRLDRIEAKVDRLIERGRR